MPDITIHDRKSIDLEIEIMTFNYNGQDFSATVRNFSQSNVTISSISSTYTLTFSDYVEVLNALKEESDSILEMRNDDLKADADIEEQESKEVEQTEE